MKFIISLSDFRIVPCFEEVPVGYQEIPDEVYRKWVAGEIADAKEVAMLAMQSMAGGKPQMKNVAPQRPVAKLHEEVAEAVEVSAGKTLNGYTREIMNGLHVKQIGKIARESGIIIPEGLTTREEILDYIFADAK